MISADISETRTWIPTKDFREKAKTFHKAACQNGRIPFGGRVFVGTTCAAYEILKSGKRLTKFKITVKTIQNIWRDYSVKTMLKYWKEINRLICARGIETPCSELEDVGAWEAFTQYFLPIIRKDKGRKFAVVCYDVVSVSVQTRAMYMEDLAYLIFSIEAV